MVFYGTQYTINQGSVSFYNPLKIDPILDIDLETKARGIDVTLTVSGPLNKLNLTPRSRPAAAVQRDRRAAGDRPHSDIRPVAAGAAGHRAAILAADGRLGAARAGDREPGRRPLAALLRRE